MTENPRRKVISIGEVDWMKPTKKIQINLKLLRACAIRDLIVAKQALEQGADVNCRRFDYMTPLHVAAEHGDVDLINLLCDNPNVELEVKTMHGLTPLHTSTLLGHRETTEELLTRGAESNSRDNMGRCPLHYAALQMDVECARVLIKFGARVNVYDTFHESPLYTSVLKRLCVPMIKLLLANRASPIFPSHKLSLGLLPEAILAAQTSSDVDIIKILARFVGNVNTTDLIAWRTPLHLVAMNGHYELAEYLIRHGADLNAKNRAGQTAMDVALICRNLNIANLIEEKRNNQDSADKMSRSFEEFDN